MADDLNRWLRAVRPPTAADDGWSDSPEADDILASIHERTGRRRSRVAAQRTRVHLWMPAAAVAAVAVLVVAVTLNSSTPASHRSGRHSAPQLRPVAKYLSPFSSCGDLLKGLRAHAAAHVTAAGLPNDGPISSLRPMVPIDVHGALPNAAGASSTSAGSAKADSANSATNVQEVGVDEPDLVKTSDGRVVTVLDG
ncbi:MAG TPA: hypothetical protein VJ831_12380, partial [Jatrophihabitantaceae bacterium]|nr:hypothetical protein [Jatrophihabitantaceae bacterium]